MTSHISIHYDGLHNEWRADLGDDVHTTLVCATLHDLEAVLDDLERQGRLKDVGFKQKAEAVYSHWREHRDIH